MRIRATGFHDVWTDRDPGVGDPVEWVYKNGENIGSIVYVTRRVATGTMYGWRPVQADPRVKLTNKHDAIIRLRQYKADEMEGGE